MIFQETWQQVITPADEYAELWDSIHTTPGNTWADSPNVWVLDFEIAGVSDGLA